MKPVDVQQGSPAWIQARLGIPTASCFDKILTPKTRKPSSQAKGYMFALLSERMTGKPAYDFDNEHMEHGRLYEAEAAGWYDLVRADMVPVTPVGFITNDAGTVGASPDMLVGDAGLLEIKCPSPAVHAAYMLEGTITDDYRCQVQGQLWIAERQWADVVSYRTDMDPVVIRVERDEEFIADLAKAVGEFSAALEARAAECREKGWMRKPLSEWSKELWNDGKA